MLYATDAQMIVIASDRHDLRSIGFAGEQKILVSLGQHADGFVVGSSLCRVARGKNLSEMTGSFMLVLSNLNARKVCRIHANTNRR
jgi:hypothetical protein